MKSNSSSSRRVLSMPLAPASAAEDDSAANERSASGRAFWATMRRMSLLAAGVDVWFFVLFRYIGVEGLAWPNLSSIALYLTAYALIRMRVNKPAMALIGLEVLLHASAGTLLIGWESGFHYYMLLFIPAIVIACRPLQMRLLLSLLFVCYVGLDMSAYGLGASAPLPEGALAVVRWTNMAIVFGVLAYAAAFYGLRLRHAEHAMRLAITHDLLTGLLNRQHFIAMSEYVLALQRRGDRPTCVAVVEIDALRTPPAHGAGEADRILQEVCHVLRKESRQQDVMARWHGDQLIVLLPDTELEEARLAAERLRQAVARAGIASARLPQPCTVCIGVAEARADEALHGGVQRALRALAGCHAQGGDRVRALASAARARAADARERRWAGAR